MSALSREIVRNIRKMTLTLESEIPFLKGKKHSLYAHIRRHLRIPHESDFEALKSIPTSLPGCYLDIGANHGQSIESILLFKPRAQIVSFEPNAILAHKLATRYLDQNNVRVVAKGLSDRTGEFTLFVPCYNGLACNDLASFDRESAAGWINEHRVFWFSSRKLDIAEIQCEVGTLDSYGLDPIFMKIDVQGSEFNVLNGARETLRRCDPILLVEDFRGNPETVRLAQDLGYDEYYFDGTRLQKGTSKTDNSFLITPQRARQLVLLSSVDESLVA